MGERSRQDEIDNQYRSPGAGVWGGQDNPYYRPSEKYPEYMWEEVSGSNAVYDSVREALHIQGWDAVHYGTKLWNPFGDIISEGDTVLIKPNLVMDYNQSGEGTECLFTQPDVAAPVIDYTVLALGGTGKILIGDAPMQECNFERLIRDSGYEKLLSYYRQKGVNISLIDMRGLKTRVCSGVRIQETVADKYGKEIDLGLQSEHAKSNVNPKWYRVTNYNPRLMNAHHTDTKHEYCISPYLLSADVIINMPKPKTHRKAGMTGALKNFVGINVRKEYLPHHTKGAFMKYGKGGDEYLFPNLFRGLQSIVLDRRNECISDGKYHQAGIYQIIIKILSKAVNLTKKDCYSEGSWYGNHTISKTIMDLNKIVLFADKNGNMQENVQRKIIIVADMIISGEKEGPVAPSPKPAGMIAVGTDQAAFDKTIALLMGFDPEKIPTLANIRQLNGKYSFNNKKEIVILSNDKSINNKKPEELTVKERLNFIPSQGWLGHIEKADK